MKIGFDARMIGHPGIGTYIRNLLKAMLAASSGDDFVLYGDPDKLSGFGREVIKYKAPVYSYGELFRSPLAKEKFDITHIPHFNAPLGGVKNMVVTIHDLIYLKVPESRSFISGIAAKFIISSAVKNAKRIIAVSENTKKDIIGRFPCAQGKVDVVYEGADPVFRRGWDEAKKSAVRNKYGLPREFILFVSAIKKHKNIERLIEVYSGLRNKGMRQRLVIVGRCSPKEDGLLKKIKSSDALYLGEIPLDDLAVVYGLAALLVFPSLYEGFGLPVLEAASSGVAVACSNASSILEVAGGAAEYFDPRDPAGMRDAILKVLSDEKLRMGLVEKGLDNLKKFSWENAAAKTLETYRKVYSG